MLDNLIGAPVYEILLPEYARHLIVRRLKVININNHTAHSKLLLSSLCLCDQERFVFIPQSTPDLCR